VTQIKSVNKNNSSTKTQNRTKLPELTNEGKAINKELFRAVSQISGGKGEGFGEMVLNQFRGIETPIAGIASMLENIRSIAPKDNIEGMLATQMIATHNAAMSFYRRANKLIEVSTLESTIKLGNDTLRLADKLARTYTLQLEALNKYRGKGQQNISVKHVHVNEGGRAIVGNINSNKESKE
jgi:hypothetical protein